MVEGKLDPKVGPKTFALWSKSLFVYRAKVFSGQKLVPKVPKPVATTFANF
jgi:hypothetical protein